MLKNFILLLFPIILFSQEEKIIEVSENHSVYLFFDSGIVHEDFGRSGDIKFFKDADLPNMIYLKAVKSFTADTSFTIITSNGKSYFMRLKYSQNPKIRKYEMDGGQTNAASISNKSDNNSVKSSNIGEDGVCDIINKKYKRGSIHGGNGSQDKAQGLSMFVKGIYYHGDKTYIQVLVENRNKSPFTIENNITFSLFEKGNEETESTGLLHRSRCNYSKKVDKKNMYIYVFDKINTKGKEPLRVSIKEAKVNANAVTFRGLTIETSENIFNSSTNL